MTKCRGQLKLAQRRIKAERLSGILAGPFIHLPLGPYRSTSLPVPAFVPSVPAYTWWSSQVWQQIKSGTTKNNVKHRGLLPPLLKFTDLLFSRWDLLQTLHRVQTHGIPHLPVQQRGAELAVGSRDRHLLGTSSLQICPFPTLCEDEEEADGPHSVAPASPHLTRCLGTHPLLPSPCLSVLKCHSLLFFLSQDFDLLSGTFISCHKNTSSILNMINYLSLLTHFFSEDIQLPFISIGVEVTQCFARSNLKSKLNGSSWSSAFSFGLHQVMITICYLILYICKSSPKIPVFLLM